MTIPVSDRTSQAWKMGSSHFTVIAPGRWEPWKSSAGWEKPIDQEHTPHCAWHHLSIELETGKLVELVERFYELWESYAPTTEWQRLT
jgi:hypothetical protein